MSIKHINQSLCSTKYDTSIIIITIKSQAKLILKICSSYCSNVNIMMLLLFILAQPFITFPVVPLYYREYIYYCGVFSFSWWLFFCFLAYKRLFFYGEYKYARKYPGKMYLYFSVNWNITNFFPTDQNNFFNR